MTWSVFSHFHVISFSSSVNKKTGFSIHSPSSPTNWSQNKTLPLPPLAFSSSVQWTSHWFLSDRCPSIAYVSQSVQLLSHARFFVTPWIAAHQASLSISNSWSLLKHMSIKSVMPSNHLILLFLSPHAPNPSQHEGLFQRVSSLHEVAKVLEFQLQHQSFQWTPRTYLL